MAAMSAANVKKNTALGQILPELQAARKTLGLLPSHLGLGESILAGPAQYSHFQNVLLLRGTCEPEVERGGERKGSKGRRGCERSLPGWPKSR